MPLYGVYPIHCSAEPQKVLGHAQGLAILGLVPLRPSERTSGFANRVRTTRGLPMARKESHHEVKRRFPDVFRGHGAEVRFSGKEELIYIPQGALVLMLESFKAPIAWPTGVIFTGNWNVPVHKLAIASAKICLTFGAMYQILPVEGHMYVAPIINKIHGFPHQLCRSEATSPECGWLYIL